MTTHNATRINYLHTVVENEQAYGRWFQKVDMKEGVLKQLNKHGLWNFKFPDRVE